jgi:hypothetical protein
MIAQDKAYRLLVLYKLTVKSRLKRTVLDDERVRVHYLDLLLQILGVVDGEVQHVGRVGLLQAMENRKLTTA